MSLPKKRILYIEDDLQQCKPYLSEIAKAGYDITHVTTAEEALNALSDVSKDTYAFHRFDLAIIDLDLPGSLQGEDLLRILKEKSPHNPAKKIVFTCKEGEAIKIKAYKEKIDGFEEKTISAKLLVEHINSLINRECIEPLTVLTIKYQGVQLKLEVNGEKRAFIDGQELSKPKKNDKSMLEPAISGKAHELLELLMRKSKTRSDCSFEVIKNALYPLQNSPPGNDAIIHFKKDITDALKPFAPISSIRGVGYRLKADEFSEEFIIE